MKSHALARVGAPARLVVLFVVGGLLLALGGFSGRPIQAQGPGDDPIARVSSAESWRAAAATPAGGAARAETKRTFAMEGPALDPGRALGRPQLSLADRTGDKVGARLVLSAASGRPGSTITLRGWDYIPGQRVNLFWDGVNVTERRLIIADFDGTFTTGLTIPSATSGAHTIAAVEASLGGAALAAAEQRIPRSTATFTVVDGLRPGSPEPDLGPPDVELRLDETGAELAQGPPTTKKWTVAVYIAGDNNLSDYASLNINQMIDAGGTNANVNVVVLSDEQNKATKVYEVRAGGVVDVTAGSGFSGNTDTGDPANFVRFMQLIKARYPAQKYAAVIWDHGGGWKAIESDDVTGNFWSMIELRTALQQGLAALGKPQFDVLIFDACLMGQYEVALEIKDYVSIMVGSEEVVPGAGYPYDTFLRPLLLNPDIDPRSWASQIVEAYKALYGPANANRAEFTLTALNLDGPFDNLRTRVNAFAEALLAVGANVAGELQIASDNTQYYHDRDFLDLGHYAQNVANRINNTAVDSAANALVSALAPGLNNVVINEQNGTSSPNSTGLTVHLPAPTGRAGGFDPRAGGFDPRTPINYDALAVKATPWYTLSRAQFTGEWPNVNTPPPPSLPPPPPPAAASTSDIVYAKVVNTAQRDLYRIQSTASSAETAETVPLLTDGFANSYPRWSADGKQVVYASDRGATAKTGLDLNLFLIDADGTGPGSATTPRQLTFGQVNCAGGPGTGATCLIEQSYDPAWVSASSGAGVGVLYTRLRYNLSAADPLQWQISQAIHLIDLSKATSDPLYDQEILGAGASSGGYRAFNQGNRKYNAYYENADFNGKYLMFRYTLLEDADSVDPADINLLYNNIGYVDLTTSPPTLVYFVFNDAAAVSSGNYLITNYPAWRPGLDELAFLYTRVGDPGVMSGVDPRLPPDPFVAENPFEGSYDIGRLSFGKNAGGYFYTMQVPIWPFVNPAEGEGVNYRPGWKPDASGNLTASYTVDGGYTYDVGLFLNAVDENFEDDRGFLITTDGYSYLPSWGRVSAGDVQARVELKPPYIEPGNGATYYVSGAGFTAGTKVEILRGPTATTVTNKLAEVTVGGDGSFEAKLTLPKGTAPGSIYFAARAGGKTSNIARLVVLTPRSGAQQFLYVPLLFR